MIRRRMLWSLLALLVGLAPSCGKKGASAPMNPAAPSGSNHVPTVNITATKTRLAFGEATTFSVTAADADGDQLTFGYSADGGAAAVSGPTATGGTFTAGTARGNVTVSVIASDGHGGSSTATAYLYVYNPDPPDAGLQILGSSCAYFKIQPSESVYVSVTVTERLSSAHGDEVIPNDATPQTIPFGSSLYVTPIDCTHSSGDTWKISVDVERPHDGKVFTVSQSRTF